jgi:hypothetical protein
MGRVNVWVLIARHCRLPGSFKHNDVAGTRRPSTSDNIVSPGVERRAFLSGPIVPLITSATPPRLRLCGLELLRPPQVGCRASTIQ